MRHPFVISLAAASLLALGACQEQMSDEEVERAVADVNVIDESNLNDIMLTVGDPNEAVAYFQRTSAQHPERMDLKRGLAKSLIKAKKPGEAARVWEEVANSPEGTAEDRVELADAFIRAGDWARAKSELNRIPPTHETFGRYRLEAMVADSEQNWSKADSFYQTAVGLTTQPAGTLNNWGFSKLTRGDYGGAEKLFGEALTYDPSMFTAKNNLVMARGAQGKYDMPVIDMSQIERAQLLHTLALAAIKRGDVVMGKTLLQEAIDTHPQHFEEAVRAMRALDANVSAG
ncbi:lipopolysaccharide assembly protein LapB [Maritimibacter sp. DP1N21-5]|uniref:tetratricopeptide repeat protein n=1 Tax=Maritimibacter sp. DP1N21-5 TaxID=2836867 RepID=UPI001C45AB70|nr:tetratricopeptide repeat protein [Maritimibacter sp. DP1N21-5]MBV7409240.1 tetratricopeptide repeat protein [Maritimibacter sp. DP1N21-5]